MLKVLIKFIIYIFVVALIGFCYNSGTVVKIKKCGVVKSKATSHNTSGRIITYHTLVLGDDGKVYDKEDISFYIVPEGNKVYWTDQEIKFK